jgi:quercetin dioxygenase-like cupin family protein
MHSGWFIGDFAPSLLRCTDCEVAIKHYRVGEREVRHYHRIAVEVTAIVSGSVWMAGRQWDEGDLVVIEPGEATDFEALTDAVTVVVKRPSVSDDKYASQTDV